MFKSTMLPANYRKRLQKHIDKIWGYVRDNRESLSSEFTCRQIEELVNTAMRPFHAMIVDRDATIAKQKEEIKTLREERKLLKAELDEYQKQPSAAEVAAAGVLDTEADTVVDTPEELSVCDAADDETVLIPHGITIADER